MSADTALRLGRYFNMSTDFWLNLQNHYDVEIAKEKLGKKLQLEVKILKVDKKKKVNS